MSTLKHLRKRLEDVDRELAALEIEQTTFHAKIAVFCVALDILCKQSFSEPYTFGRQREASIA